jgi:hypothetical protein
MSVDVLLQRTVDGYRKSLATHMPESPFRHFALWATSSQNPRRDDWLQVFGIIQLVRLTAAIFESCGSAIDDQIVHASVPISVYFAHEISSDNLEIGLLTAQGAQAKVRRQLLLTFNTAMEERLRGSAQSAERLLLGCKQLASEVSCFQQTLVSNKYQLIAQSYAQNSGRAPAELEFSFWPQLVANIESCKEVADSMPDEPALRIGLINRYRAVTELLHDEFESVSHHLRASADAILVAPTLIYYARLLRADADRGTLVEAAFNAAVLVRLLNDLGSPMLIDHEQRAQFLSELVRSSRTATGSLPQLLKACLPRFGPLLARLHKDATHGEFNLGLYRLETLPASAALWPFRARLEHLARLYECHRANLSALLAALPASVSRLISRFVQFHEALYARPHTSEAGEYSV